MRMTDDRDQELLRSAVADTAANFLAFLPSLGTGEAFAFGEGVALPTRMKFRQLPAQLLPKSETVTLGDTPTATDNHSLAMVVERWRGRVAKPRLGGDRSADEVKQVAAALSGASQLQPQNSRRRLKPSLRRSPAATGCRA